MSNLSTKTERIWGYYTTDENVKPKWKLKTLYVLPGRSLSYQRHNHRSEVWLVKEGKGTAVINHDAFLLEEGDVLTIDKGEWHQLINGGQDVLVIHEIQHGELCDEEDIERV